MELRTTVSEYVEGVNKVTEGFKKLFADMVFEESFEPSHIELLQSTFGLIETSTRLICDQAIMIQDINDKLDKLETK